MPQQCFPRLRHFSLGNDLLNHIYQATALGPGAQHSLNFEVLHECITVRFLSLLITSQRRFEAPKPIVHCTDRVLVQHL